MQDNPLRRFIMDAQYHMAQAEFTDARYRDMIDKFCFFINNSPGLMRAYDCSQYYNPNSYAPASFFHNGVRVPVPGKVTAISEQDWGTIQMLDINPRGGLIIMRLDRDELNPLAIFRQAGKNPIIINSGTMPSKIYCEVDLYLQFRELDEANNLNFLNECMDSFEEEFADATFRDEYNFHQKFNILHQDLTKSKALRSV